MRTFNCLWLVLAVLATTTGWGAEPNTGDVFGLTDAPIQAASVRIGETYGLGLIAGIYRQTGDDWSTPYSFGSACPGGICPLPNSPVATVAPFVTRIQTAPTVVSSLSCPTCPTIGQQQAARIATYYMASPAPVVSYGCTGVAYASSGQAMVRTTGLRFSNYVARWTWPGGTPGSLANHLAGAPHYADTAGWSHDQRERYHDGQHDVIGPVSFNLRGQPVMGRERIFPGFGSIAPRMRGTGYGVFGFRARPLFWRVRGAW